MLFPALFVVSIAFQDTVASPRFDHEVLRLVDSIASAEFAKDSLGSISVGVVSGPTLVWSKSYGYVVRGRRQKATPATVYRVASITKQLTAVMLLQLAERKVVRLSDPVAMYVPQISALGGQTTNASPTLGQLASMTSGIARDPDDKRVSQSGAVRDWSTIMLSALPRTTFARVPGAGYGYSNIGYSILGAALARAAGEEYTAYQRGHLLSPLGMSSTDFILSAQMRARLAQGVDWDELTRDTLNYADAAREHETGLGWRVPAGGLYSTVEDLAKFVSLELGFGPETVLSSAARKARDAFPVAAALNLDYGYGLGFQAYRWADTVAVGHSGNLAGYTSMVLYDPQRKYGVIVLRSAAGGEADAGRLAGRAYRKLRSTMVSPPKQ